MKPRNKPLFRRVAIQRREEHHRRQVARLRWTQLREEHRRRWIRRLVVGRLQWTQWLQVAGRRRQIRRSRH